MAAQSRFHGERGIARYTLDLAQRIERLRPDLVAQYLIDLELPIGPALYGLIGSGKVTRVDDPAVQRADVFHVTSPFEPVPHERVLPGAAVGPDTRVIATLYDVIPAIFPEVYLTDTALASWYHGRCDLLLAANRLVTISDATRTDAISVLGIPERHVTSIYGGASAIFSRSVLEPAVLIEQAMAAVPGLAQRFVLMPSGIEWRKNIAGMFEAFAMLPRALRDELQLVVQCGVSPQQREDLMLSARDLGIDEQLLLTGFVGDEALVSLYRAAEVVVFPSHYEGLGLPVLEARRCGAPVICGDNSSLRELVPDSSARFDASSPRSMAEVLEDVLAHSDRRSELRNSPVPPCFDWDQAAMRMIAVYESELELARRPARGRRPRVAIVGPVPPEASGIADYLDALLVPLSERWDVTVFTASDPSLVQLAADLRVEPLSALEHIERFEGSFDQVIHHIGNSEMHVFQPTFLRQRPAAVVLHDSRLTGLYGQIALLRPDLCPGGIGQALHQMYPNRYPPTLAGGGELPHAEVLRFGVLMCAEVARNATTVLAHSRFAAGLIELDSGVPVEHVHSHPVRLLDSDPLSRDEHLVVSFGLVDPVKRPDLIIEAMAEVAVRLPEAKLAFVGPIGPENEAWLRSVVRDLALETKVTFTGALDRFEYEALLARATVAVQLRRWTNGESSGAVADLLGAGVPIVASALGSMNELPSTSVTLVSPEVTSSDLAEAIFSLLSDPERRLEMSRAARGFATQNSYEAAAAALDEFFFAEWPLSEDRR